VSSRTKGEGEPLSDPEGYRSAKDAAKQHKQCSMHPSVRQGSDTQSYQERKQVGVLLSMQVCSV